MKDEETDRRYSEAIVRAVELGANVIDTAANYRFQLTGGSVTVQIFPNSITRTSVIGTVPSWRRSSSCTACSDACDVFPFAASG